MANKYELMAGRIEAVLGAQKVPARVWQVTVSHRYSRFDLTIPLGVKISKMTTLQEELAFSLGAPAVTVYRDGGVLHVEVPKDGPVKDYTLPFGMGQVKAFPPATALLGERTDGTPLLLKVDSPDIAHILISGTTGSGKTVLLRAILLTLAMTNHPGSLQLVLIDPKRDKLGPLAAFPHAWQGLGVIDDPGEAARLLKHLVDEMRRRSKASRSLPRIIVAIDELADLIATGGSAITDALQALTQAGREPGLHVIAATQRPSAALVGGMVKANFPARLVGSVVSTEDAKVAAGIGGTGAERLTGRGDFLLVVKGQQIRFQGVNVTDQQVRAIAGAVWRNGRRSRAWSEFALQQVLSDPPPLPEQGSGHSRVVKTVTDVVTVTGDSTPEDEKFRTSAFFRLTGTESPVTVTAPAPSDGLTPEEQLNALLPIGSYLRMVEPDAHERALLRLAYSVKRTTNATLLRVYGQDSQGRIRKNGRTLAWLNAALAEGPDLTAPGGDE